MHTVLQYATALFANKLDSRVQKVVLALPFLMLCAIFASIPFMAYQAIFTPGKDLLNVTNIFFAVSILLTGFYCKQIWIIWTKKTPKFSEINYILLLFGLLLIANRFLIYFHAIDDFVHHMVQGYFARTFWNSDNFLPFGFLSYLYPFIQVSYSYFLDILGIRLTILFFELGKLFWLLNLNTRFATLLQKKINLPIWITNIVFFIFYSMPEVAISHATFMSDLFSLLFGLEFLYLYLIKSEFRLLFIMFLGSILSKQSSGFVVLPLSIYLLIKAALQDIKGFIKEIALPAILVSISFIRTWIDTANPIAGLYNSFFHSSLFDPQSFRDRRWGPSTWYETMVWPLYAYFSPRYFEFPISVLVPKIAYALAPITVFLSSVFLAVRRKSLLFIIVIISFYFWSLMTGYGRYFITMFAMSTLLLLYGTTFKNLSKLRFNPKKPILVGGILVIFAAVLGIALSAFRVDYASRPQFTITWSKPWILNPHFKQLTTDGLSLLRNDKPIDVYHEIQHDFDGITFNAVVVVERGLSTYYANIIGRFMDIPVYSGLSPEVIAQITTDPRIDEQLKNNARLSVNNFPILLVVDNDPYLLEHKLPQTELYKSGRCQQITVGNQSRIFPHENYFGYVQKYICT